MNAKPENKTGWQFFVRKVFRWLFLVVGAIATFVAGQFLYFRFAENSVPTEKMLYTLVNLIAIAFCLWLLSPILRRIFPPFIRLIKCFYHWLFTWQTMRRVLITLAVLATLTALFYTEEDWRGKRAWETYKRVWEAKGEKFDWQAFVPPPVPDDQNFFKAPNLQAWFVGRGRSELSKRLQTTNEALTASVGAATNLIATTEAGKNYLAWSDQFEPDFDLMREALKRPYARMDGDYSMPYAVPIPNFLTVRAVAQMLSQRAHCYLLLNQPDKALQELTPMHDMCRLFESAPTGKPMTLLAAMLNVAATGLYVDTIAEGFQRHAWQGPQIIALQEQLGTVSLLPFVVEAFQEDEHVTTAYALEKMPPAAFVTLGGAKLNLRQKLENPFYIFLTFAPRGWVYQNMVTHTKLLGNMLNSYDLTNDLIFPSEANKTTDEIHALKKWSPYAFLEAISLPNFTRATQSLAYNQALVNEAQIACALERYRLAHGEYPETLDALVPQFIEELPHDIIGGQPSQGSGSASQPLHYHRTNNGQFVLYSVGWNETDDGGDPGTLADPTQGDWVWKN
jgi:hypothetical protein